MEAPLKIILPDLVFSFHVDIAEVRSANTILTSNLMTIVSIQYKAKNIRAPLLVKGIGLWSLHANKGFQNGLCGRAQQLIVPPYRITPFNAPFFKGGRRENAVK